MLLCLQCGRIEDHDVRCARRLPPPKSPSERAERALRAVRLALSSHAGVEKSRKATPPRVLLLRLLSAERLLEQHPAASLDSYEDKRAFNEAATKLAKARADLEATLPAGEGARLAEDFPFAKQAIELLFAQTCRRIEAQKFDMASIPRLLGLQPEPRPALADVCGAIEKRLEESRGLDEQVRALGWKNLRGLMAGLAPVEEKSGGVLGALVGRSGTARFKLQTDFKVLGERFRERLYLLGVNTIVLRVVSRLAQADEAWRRHLGKADGPARLERVKRENDVIAYILGPRDGEGSVESVVAQLAASSPGVVIGAVRPFESLKVDEWEVFAMAYFFELDAVMGGLSSRDVGMSGVALALLDRPQGVEPDHAAIERTLQGVRDTWRARPPREVKKGSG